MINIEIGYSTGGGFLVTVDTSPDEIIHWAERHSFGELYLGSPLQECVDDLNAHGQKAGWHVIVIRPDNPHFDADGQ